MKESPNTKIRCTAVAGHGKALRQALENSCNNINAIRKMNGQKITNILKHLECLKVQNWFTKSEIAHLARK